SASWRSALAALVRHLRMSRVAAFVLRPRIGDGGGRALRLDLERGDQGILGIDDDVTGLAAELVADGEFHRRASAFCSWELTAIRVIGEMGYGEVRPAVAVVRHCERSEAISRNELRVSGGVLSRFALLAMTATTRLRRAGKARAL